MYYKPSISITTQLPIKLISLLLNRKIWIVCEFIGQYDIFVAKATLVFVTCCCFFINVFSNMSLIYIKPTSKYIFYYRFSDLCYETDRILKYLLLKHILYFCCHSKHKLGFKLVVVVVVDLYLDIQNRAILVIGENRTCEHLYL